MNPVLLSIGNLQVSAFGLFLTLGIFFGGFSIWRIARGYELDSEKILDLSFLTIGIGFICARLVYVLSNLAAFDSLTKVFFLNIYPGLSFSGGFTGGLVALVWLAKKNKINILAAGDFAIVGFLLGAFFAEIGCLLGGCGVGVETDLFFGVMQIGVIGKHFPIQLLEGLTFLFSFFVFWKEAIKFHVQGSLLSKGLILVGLTKLLSGFLKLQVYQLKILNFNLNPESVVSAALFLAGLGLYYYIYKKTPADDLRKVWKIFSNKKTRSQVLANISKGCYNHWVNLRVNVVKGKIKLFKLLNIKPNPDNF